MITFNLFGGWYVMPYQDATMYLIICYVFGILTSCAIYLIFIIPTTRKKYDKGYHDRNQHPQDDRRGVRSC